MAKEGEGGRKGERKGKKQQYIMKGRVVFDVH